MRGERILDVRTKKPIEYSELENEAAKLAEGDERKLPTAERRVAAKANPNKEENIVRRLRERRRRRPPSSQGVGVFSQPIPGYGVFIRDLAQYARKLEDEMNRAVKRQELSRPRVELIKAQAERLYDIAEKRFDYLAAIEEEEAPEMLRPFLEGLDEVSLEMDPSSFISAERRQAELILMMTSRILREASSCLQFLK